MNREQEAKEQIRQQLEQLIDSARIEIELVIAAAERAQHEGEGSDHIDGLKAQLTTLLAQSSHIQHGSLAQLQVMQTTLPRAVSSVRQSSQALAQKASFEIGQHVVEMTMEKVHMLQAKHDQQSANFTNYEARSASRIDQLAQSGGIDVSGYQDNRLCLKADIEEAKRNGDRVAQFNAQAQLAANNTYGLIKAGASDAEIEASKAKEAEQRAILLKEKEIEARRAGELKGLSGDALRNHVDQQSKQAATELDQENFRNAQNADLSPAQMAQAGLSNSAEFAQLKENENERTSSGSIKTAESKDERSSNKEDRFNVLLAASDLTISTDKMECSDASCDDHANPSHVEAAVNPDQVKQFER